MMEERDHNVDRRGGEAPGRGAADLARTSVLWIVLIALCIGAVYWVLQGAFQQEPSREETAAG